MTNDSKTAVKQEPYLRLADGRRLPVLKVETRSEVERVRSLTAQRPDETWSATDTHGHVHRYVRDAEDVPRLPSLEPRSRHVECDGSCYSVTHGDCEGYDITVWLCRVCGDEVEPGFKPDYEAMDPGIPVYQTNSYTLEVEVAEAHDTIKDSVYVQGEFEKEFPFLHNASYEVESTFGESRMVGVYHAEETRSVKRKPVGP